MKGKTRFLLPITVSFLVLNGCGDDSSGNSRTKDKTCLPGEHWTETGCVGDTAENCGEQGKSCLTSVEGWANGSCQNGQCIVDACQNGFHLSGNACEKDTVENCGKHGEACNVTVRGWKTGACVGQECVVESCLDGFHLFGKACEVNSVENCGNHDVACKNVVPGWKDGICQNGECSAITCKDGLHIYQGKCEIDDTENCAAHGADCTQTMPGFALGTCSQGKCLPAQCKPGFHLANESCQKDTNQCCGSACTSCQSPMICSNGACGLSCDEPLTECDMQCVNYEVDPKHCGNCETDCSENMPENAQSMACVASQCQIEKCKDNFHLKDGACVADTTEKCGVDETNCTEITGWKTGACQDGNCVLETCQDNYHLLSGFCEEDTVANCGEHDVVCEENQQCVDKNCECAQGWMVCNDVCTNVQSEFEHCGACDTVCGRGQTCVDGNCDGEIIVDTDGDSILDTIDSCDNDTDGDTIPDCEDLDSDNDGVSDHDEYSVDHSPDNFRNPDVDGDGLLDGMEVKCSDEVYSRYTADTDGDGFSDLIEYAAAIENDVDPADYICDDTKTPDTGLYFELPYCGDGCIKEKCGDNCLSDTELSAFQKNDSLNFVPSIQKLDLVFNVDTTNTMGADIKNLQDNIGSYIIPKVRERVSDSAFGVTRFDDFPTRPTLNSKYDFFVGNGIESGAYGRVDDCPNGTETQPDLNKTFRCDRPFDLLGKPETDPNTVQANVNKLGLHHGGDKPESGFEALWQIVMGDDTAQPQVAWYKYGNYTTFNSGSIAYTPKSSERWGGAQFRNSTLPVVIHITDSTAHDSATNCSDLDKEGNPTCKPYDPAYVENAHYSAETLAAYKEKGARVISIYDARDGLNYQEAPGTGQLAQLVNVSNETSAIVPVCAFKTDAENWKCRKDKCCTISPKGETVGIKPDSKNNCVLSYAIEGASALSETLVDGVDALVKYGVSDVVAVVHGNSIEGSSNDTSCFIKSVEAFVDGYVAPPQEPEASCNPVALPAKFNGSEYNNGYSNFAYGTSSSEKMGSQLNFSVTALNDSCVEQTDKVQTFTAEVELVDVKTNASYGKKTISIVVPAKGFAGNQFCDDNLVNTSLDSSHCGDCDTSCQQGEYCSEGKCINTKPTEDTKTQCGGRLVTPYNDSNHCGGCDVQCSSGEYCDEGACTSTQPNETTTTFCNGREVHPGSDAANCGACGNACADGQICSNSSCVCADGHYDCDGNLENGCESTVECTCQPKTMRKCWRGEESNLTGRDENGVPTGVKGTCKLGEQVCSDNGKYWGPCIGGILPLDYNLDTFGQPLAGDNNCNGTPDNLETVTTTRCDSIAGSTSYIGCEYWPVFLQNLNGFSTTTNVYFDLTLVISNPSKTETAEVYVFTKDQQTSSNPYKKFTVAPGAVKHVTLVGKEYGSYGYTASYFANGESCKEGASRPANTTQCSNNKSKSNDGNIDKYMMKGTMQAASAFRVVSTTPIVVYQFNPYGKPETHSADASLLMPKSVLGKDYLTMGYESQLGAEFADAVNIVAVEPGETSVTIKMKAATLKSADGKISAFAANGTKTIKMNQFDVLSIEQSGASNSTGSRIEATKRVEVFGSAGCGMVPTNEYYCDHLEEQIFPLQTWGTKYEVVKSHARATEKDHYYILSSKADTTVTLRGGEFGNAQKHALGEGEYYMFETDTNFDVEANNPILVGQFLVGSAIANKIGDPSFILNVPSEQYRTEYSFAVPDGYQEDWVTIIAPKAAVIKYTGKGFNGTTYTDKNINDLPDAVAVAKKQAFGKNGYVYYYLKLKGGTHSLSGDLPFGVTGYGFFNDTSYGYPIGLDLKPLNMN